MQWRAVPGGIELYTNDGEVLGCCWAECDVGGHRWRVAMWRRGPRVIGRRVLLADAKDVLLRKVFGG